MILSRAGGLGLWSLTVALGLPLGARLRGERQVDSTKAFRDSVATAQKAIDAGRDIFHGRGTCFGCHGAKLEGTAIAPTLRAHKWRNGDGSLEMILRVIDNGVKGTAMVSHPGGITEGQVHLVAAYVYAVSHGVASP
jgi:mono/diheme cytochrome c family protein